ncbi:putative capsid maturation protease [Mycobacterium phage Henu3]|uniref:Putative capsid maturation protease n=1 Tax=Mycobacterium phage Henu3 TaxID=2492961 RepID=A0A410T7W4_9CAUD|nr:head maturation protease [Mycobacterium phage Henu3]QAU05023.1 putative capsid maturation protease [Mycobacterium phage Henu3]
MTQAVPEFQGALQQLAIEAGNAGRRLVSRMGELSTAEGLQLVTDAYPELIEPFVVASGEMTAQWYGENMVRPVRRIASERLFLPEPAELPSRQRLAKSGRWAVLQRDPGTAIVGSSTRWVFDESRRTVNDNAEREGVRWTRYASANACGFCRMLATRVLTVGERGAPGLYRTKAAAEASPHTPDVRGHDHCKCIAVPVRDGYTPPGYVYDWLDDYNAVSRDDDGYLLPEWKIADLMERRAEERLGRKRRPRGRPRAEGSTPGGGQARRSQPREKVAAEDAATEFRRDDAGRFIGERRLFQRNHEQAAQIARAARDRVASAQRIVSRADSYVGTAARISGHVKTVTDVAAKYAGGAYPVLRDVKVVVDAADKALGSAARVTGGANRALTLVDKTIKDTEAIAHATKQLADEARSVIDDVTFVAVGARQLVVDAGEAARATAANAREVRDLASLRSRAAETAATVDRLQEQGLDLADRARSALATLQSLPLDAAELPDRLRAPLNDIRKLLRSLRSTADDARLAVDDAAGLARAVRSLVEAVAEYRRYGFTDSYSRTAVYAYSTRVVDELGNVIGGVLPAPKTPDMVRPPTWVLAERIDLPPTPRRPELPAGSSPGAAEVPEVAEAIGVRELPPTPTLRALEAAPDPAEVIDGEVLSVVRELPPTPTLRALEAAPERPDVADVAGVRELPPSPTLRALERAPEPEPELPPAPRTLDVVEAELNAAIEVGDEELIDRLVAEMDALEEAERQAAAKAAERERRKAERQAAKAAQKEAEDRARWDRIGELIEQGYDPIDAEAEVLGVDPEKLRRRDFMAQARAEGHKGKGFDELLSSVFTEKAAEQYWQAEQATNGYMLKRKYEGKVDPTDIWHVNERTARAWMSDELAAWFDENGRLTKQLLRESILSGRANWRNPLQEDFLQ